MGIPLVKLNVDYDDNDELMIEYFKNEITAMLTKLGCTDIQVNDSNKALAYIFMNGWRKNGPRLKNIYAQ